MHGLARGLAIRRLLAAILVALAVPASASAALATMRVQEVPLHGARSLAAAGPAQPFDMVAAHWLGSGSVDYRTRDRGGRWRPWRAADADDRVGAWHASGLDWAGASTVVAFRVHGDVRRLRSYEVESRVTSAPTRAVASAGMPVIVPRAGWDANEEIVRAKPVIASSIRLAIVHHTAGTNTYTRAQAPAIVRGIELYHVLGNGWNDIGYNFLVDRFGTIYEGRGGGIDRNVVGAHAQGFNVGTVGVALLGNFDYATPTAAQQNALVRLLAWRLDVAHLDPESRVLYTSGGNYKYRAGRVVTLRAISGHRDTGPSECPGTRAYALLPAIARRVDATGLPKLYAPQVLGVLGGPVRFRATLSSPLSWTVTINDAGGTAVASGSGAGRYVDWTWRSAGAGRGPFTWQIGGVGVLPATGTLGAVPGSHLPALSLTGLTSAPALLAPGADGSGAAASATFVLGSAARVVAQLQGPSGAVVATVLDAVRPAGTNAVAWSAAAVPDGDYRLVVTASAAGRSVRKAVSVVVDRTLTELLPSAVAISPNGDGVSDTTTVSFTLAVQLDVHVDVLRQGVDLGAIFDGTLGPGPASVTWDGSVAGAPVGDGSYVLSFAVTGPLGLVQQTVPVTVDLTPPTLTLVDPARLLFTLSEPATVTVTVNGASRIVVGEPAGTFAIPFSGTVTSVVAQAQDFAGNLSQQVSAG